MSATIFTPRRCSGTQVRFFVVSANRNQELMGMPERNICGLLPLVCKGECAGVRSR